MKEEPQYPSIDLELEARIIALVLGEASDFERDELERLINERPELAAFKKEMQCVHGMLRGVAAGESIAEDDDWKLPAEKRREVLGVISGETIEPPTIHPPTVQLAGKSDDPQRRENRSLFGRIAKIAAVLLVAGFLGGLMLPSQLAHREAASIALDSRDRFGAAESRDQGAESLFDNASAPPLEMSAPEAELSEAIEIDYEDRLKSSFSAIRDNLSPQVAVPAPVVATDPDVPVDVRQLFSQETGRNTASSNGALPLPQLLGEKSGFQRDDERGSESKAGDNASVGLAVRGGVIRGEMRDGGMGGGGMGGGGGGRTSARQLAEGRSRSRGQLELPVLDPQVSGQDSGQGQNQLLRRSKQPRYAQEFPGEPVPVAKDFDSDGPVEDGGEHETPPADGFAFGIRPQATKPLDELVPQETVQSELGVEFRSGVVRGTVTARPKIAGIGGTNIEEEAAPSRTDESKKSLEDLNATWMSREFMDAPAIPSIAVLSDAGIASNKELDVADQPESKAPAHHNLYRQGGANYGASVGSDPEAERGETPAQANVMAAKEPGSGFFYAIPTFDVENGSVVRTMEPAKKFVAPAGLGEQAVEDEPFSTFSLHVSDVSFKLARAALASGTWPDAAKIRIEEFVNAFDYGDPMPSQSETVACRVEQSVHPFLQQRNLLRVSMRTAAAGRSSDTPLRLTFLLDNSGSMERIDRQQTVRRAFALLAQQLKPIDQVTLISFARQPRLLADKVSGAQSRELLQIIENLPSEGGTNIEAALQLAFEKAREQMVDHAQNRIILLTDGAVNLGDADPESLSRRIATMRRAGIAFDAAGISAEGLNDEILEALTRKGDGRYYLLDSLEAADEGFARQIAGALRPSAKNVKVQIEFNSERVARYKLLGFEKHRLSKEDFRDDKVDAAEMAAAEAGVAVYQFEAKPDGQGDVGSVSVRFFDVSTQQMIENCWPIPYQPDAPRLDQAAPSLRIAATAALLAAKLRGEALGETVDLKTLAGLIAGLPDQDRSADRVGELEQMIALARQVSGK